MNTRRFLAIFSMVVMFFTIGLSVRADEPAPVKWRMTVKMTSPTEGVVTMRAIITDGWHLYSTKLPEDGPVPTSFDFKASKGIKFKGDFKPSSPTVSKKDATFGMVLDWWAKDVSFTRSFTLTGDIKDAVISGSVRFMACNDQNCMPPKTQSFTVSPKAYTAK